MKKANTSRRSRLSDVSGSELTDLDNIVSPDDDDSQFPTFVSASAISSSSSSSSASSSSEASDSDSSSAFHRESSIEAEEEDYIIAEERRAHDKARIRRELLGDDGPSKRRDARDSWVIRPRKKSVGPSDVEMKGDSDNATDDEDDEDDDDDEDEEDEEETDGRGPGVTYVGVATGWSEDDDESSFDADLFFANLSDSTTDADSSQAEEPGDDGDALSVNEAAAAARRQMDNLLFEVTEGWDGQIVFTNGLREGQGILDIDFEVNAAQLVVDASPSPSQGNDDPDVQMTDGEDREYEDEDEDYDLEQTDGETTEEDLVGKNGLPTERAMRLFRFPSNVSAINPMSTMSPTASPTTHHRRVKSHLDPPRPADILAGKIFWDELDGHAGGGGGESNARGTHSATSSKGGIPVMGQFDSIDTNPQRRVIIDQASKDIPSPFRRYSRGRGRSRVGSLNRVCSVSSIPFVIVFKSTCPDGPAS